MPDGVYEIPLPFKRPPLTLNGRYHWAEQNRLTQQLRMIGKVKTRHLPEMEKCRVELVWYVNTRHRRDTINPSLTLKALVDGMVDAEVIPDDTYQHVETQVVIEYVPKTEREAGLLLRITEKGTTNV